ncbi:MULTISPECIES: hypothetical protein [Prosthecochloris]|uniref:LapA family protein n=1 Tax=Prosthecochloris vibrioformis TaxID=1098 RepID=A0A5C4RZ82_PROVB|nr:MULTISPECIES: hypothetical protein [Prosthecochloris]ANT65353.1 hypothetical protein Ptc2401_01609 [Prosthecochloris sp. CIB 2401]TNJ36228.1 hypothetical protein FGF68_08290 [Prosthecochloris vibrioformis]
MKPHTITMVGLLFLVLLFAALNWQLFAQSGAVNFVLYRVEAPLGLIMLAIVGIMSVLYTFFIGRLELASLLQERKQSKALEEARDLAARSEKSRITELEANLGGRIDACSGKIDALEQQTGQLLARFDELEKVVDRLAARFDEEGVYIVRQQEDDEKNN